MAACLSSTDEPSARGHSRVPVVRRLACGLVLLVGSGTLPACSSVIRYSAQSAAAEVVNGLNQSIRRQPDPELVRQGLPTLLLLLDGLTIAEPEELGLRRQASYIYSTYAQAFTEGEPRALLLHEKARGHALALLELLEIADPVYAPFDEFQAAVDSCESIDDLYVAGSSWLGWILADTNSMDAVADVPRALALLERVMELDADHANGGAHLVFGLYKVGQPRGAGQDLVAGRAHFDRAIELAGSDALLPRVLRAEFLGKATLDRDYFVAELEKVVESPRNPDSPNALENALARERAKQLLSRADRIF